MTKKTSLLLIASLVVIACDQKSPATEPTEESKTVAPTEEPDPQEKVLSSWEGTQTAQLLEKIDASIAFHQKRAAADESSWLDLEKVASGHMSRARLTGSYDEYAEAEKALEKARERSGEKTGPNMTEASFNFAVHRFDKVEPLLKRVEKKIVVRSGEKAEISATRGDLEVSAGDFQRAEEFYQKALELDEKSAQMVRMAHLERYRGNLEEATKWIEKAIEASKSDSKFEQAWTRLQAGILELEKGAYDSAMKHYQAANELFSGWYLILEHIAEIHAIKGENDKAEAMYREILEHVPNPEFMDALADVLEAKGQNDEASTWRKRATAEYREQLELFPRAAYGHAVGHFIGRENEFAVELAKKNLEVRPGPQAALTVAEAQMAAGNMEGAVSSLDKVEQSPYRAPDFHAMAYWIKTRAKADGAAKHKDLATEMNPDIVEEFAWMGE